MIIRRDKKCSQSSKVKRKLVLENWPSKIGNFFVTDQPNVPSNLDGVVGADLQKKTL